MTTPAEPIREPGTPGQFEAPTPPPPAPEYTPRENPPGSLPDDSEPAPAPPPNDTPDGTRGGRA